MKKEEIHLSDLQRILFGEAPPAFLPEVILRTLIIYLFLLFIIRWLGKRMSGQLTIMEMTIMLTLGAIVSVAMQVPDRGILLSAAILLFTLTVQRFVGWWSFKSSTIQRLTEGELSMLVKDGRLQLKEMEKCRISRQQLFGQLRCSQVFNLGMVKRVYLESNGLFSIYMYKTPRYGLPLLPPDDQRLINTQAKSDEVACANCGHTEAKNAASDCADCGSLNWAPAIITIQ
ncbi:DUF421 domain-containing protein [Mucilaginibacter defluvii]|uniref:DUF421 domain-containing protein n=1 Tax=Mucilaginibacter defluvii TaxID=1196019 RepID=A0ABP9FJ98_9SPHI